MQLYEHQQTAVEYLNSRRHAMLFDDQGLGKTPATVVALADTPLVVALAPTNVVWNWAREWRRWTGRDDVTILDGPSADFVMPRSGLVVMSHGRILNANVRAQLLSARPDAVVLDESHFFRSPSALRARQFFGIDVSPSVVSTAGRVICLTGTPTPNGVHEMWVYLRHLTEGTPETYGRFRKRFCLTRPNLYGGEPVVIGVNPDTVAELRQRITPNMLRRLKRNVLTLPPLRYESVILSGSKAFDVRALEGELTAKQLKKMEDDAGWSDDPRHSFQAMGAAVPFSRWARLCGIAKVEPAFELLEPELHHQKLVIFGVHTAVLSGLRAKFEDAGHRCVSLVGGQTAKQRDDYTQQFQTDPEVRAVLCNIVAGGTGATLTAASELVFLEMSFVPGENAQAAARIERIGQTEPMRIRVLSLAGTVDEVTSEINLRKVKMIKELIE